ncbi:MAG: DUF3800 domain-containing protein [Candidatus Sulfotelmatobacter sp.]
MEAYFDESGIHDRARVCVVAGFYGNQEAWRNFESGWNDILSKHPELDGEGFHAKRFYARKDGKRVGRYKDWSDAKAREFLERLATHIVSSTKIFPIAYAVIVDDFMNMPLRSRQWLTGAKFAKHNGKPTTSGCPNKPYYMPFTFCVLKAAQKSAFISSEKLHVFVGLDRTFHGYASNLYRFLTIDERLPMPLRAKLGTLANPLAKDTPGLQAADLLAYTMYDASLIALTRTMQKKAYYPPVFLMRLLRNWQGDPSVRLMNSEVFLEMERAGEAEYKKMFERGMLPR